MTCSGRRSILWTIIFVAGYEFMIVSSGEELPIYCVNNTTTCLSQLQNMSHLNESDCTIEYVASQECEELSFVNVHYSDRSSVKLQAHLQCESNFCYVIPKVLMNNIKWESLKFKFMEQNGKSRFCRNFKVSPNYSIPELYYDCRWTVNDDKDSNFIFVFEVGMENHRETGRYLFKLPDYFELSTESEKDLSEWKPFVYIDITDSPTFHVRWQQAPIHFGPQTYEVKVFDNNEERDRYEIKGNGEGELSYKFYEVIPAYGVYRFEVRVLNNSCSDANCIAVSPVINVGNSSKIILVVIAVGISIFFIMVLLSMYVWRIGCPVIKAPRALIIYTQSYDSHINFVKEFAIYLRDFCYIDVLLDELDVPFEQDQDPQAWCIEAFKNLDFVIIVSSPRKCCREDGMYKNLDEFAVNILMERLGDKNFKAKVFVVVVPYSDNVPEKAMHFSTKFRFPEDLNKMLSFLITRYRFSFLCNLKPPGGKHHYLEYGDNVHNAMQKATQDVCRKVECVTKKERSDENESTSFREVPSASNWTDNESDDTEEKKRNVGKHDFDTLTHIPSDLRLTPLLDRRAFGEDVGNSNGNDRSFDNYRRDPTVDIFDINTLSRL